MSCVPKQPAAKGLMQYEMEREKEVMLMVFVLILHLQMSQRLHWAAAERPVYLLLLQRVLDGEVHGALPTGCELACSPV